MKLPNGEQAEISVQKLIGYCLNSEHPSGKLADTQGSEYAIAALRADEILVLHYDLAIA
ncbi:MAG: hypothetical protein V7K21_21090 [Nostoc sp.]|uniref:hypothetical protein n=1 Tax=Nostoc sp. TaxID=1180 RepID=UPI002FF8DC26